jgi:hypothetical protein
MARNNIQLCVRMQHPVAHATYIHVCTNWQPLAVAAAATPSLIKAETAASSLPAAPIKPSHEMHTSTYTHLPDQDTEAYLQANMARTHPNGFAANQFKRIEVGNLNCEAELTEHNIHTTNKVTKHRMPSSGWPERKSF